MISNDEVAAFVEESEGRFVVLAQSTLRTWRRHEKFVVVFMSSDLRPLPVALVMAGTAYGPSFILSIRLLRAGCAILHPDWAYGSAYASEVGRPIYLDQVARFPIW